MNVRVPLVLQAAPADCGPACAAMVLSSSRREPLSVEEIDELSAQASRDGMSIGALRRVLHNGGIQTRALRVNDSGVLPSLPTPQILYWDENHFVVAERYARGYVVVADPALGRRRVPWEEFGRHFTNVVIAPKRELLRGARRQSLHRNGKFRIKYMLGLSDARYLRRLTGIGLATVALNILSLGTVFVLRLTLSHVGVTVVNALLTALTVLAAIEVTGLGLRGLLIAGTQTETEAQMHTKLFECILQMEWSFFQRRSKGDLLSRLEFVRELYSRLFHDFVLTMFGVGTSVITLAALATVNIVAAVAVILTALACFVTARLIRDNFVSAATTAVEARIRLGGFVDEVLHNLEGLKGVRAEPAVGEMWRSRRTRLASVSRGDRLRSNALDAVQSAVVRATQVVVVAIAALTASRTESAGNLVAVLTLSGMSLTPLLLAIRNYVTWGEMESYVTRFNDLLERLPTAPRMMNSRAAFERLAVRNVSYAYGGGRKVLDSLTFDISSGEHIGIWAPSGTGKTTLLRIIAGSLQPTEGSVHVNERPLADALADGFFCGVVPQDPAVISGTIAENIRVAKPDANDDEVMAACSAAGLAADISQMPAGLETRLAVNGGGISGGQRQRIAIARAVLSCPDVLLLDEATAALDYRTEASIIRNLRHMTLIVVSHREDLMHMMDRVISLTGPVQPPEARS